MKEALTAETKAEACDVKPLDDEEENPADEEGDRNDAKEEVSEQTPAYQKDGFFDTLSTDRETSKRPTGSETRELDEETFGKIGSTYRCRTQWFRRWRGNLRGRGSSRGGRNQRSTN